MDVSLIIPALNEEAVIASAVRRAWEAGASEVIVVDGGSDDRTREIAAQQDCRLIESSPGRAVQQNAGAMAASGEVLLFVHADNWLARGAVRQVTKALRKPSIYGGAFEQHIDATGYAYRLLEATNAWRVRWWGMAFGDQGIFLRREFFFALGGFPEVRLMEDVMLMEKFCRRARPVLLPGPMHVNPRRWQRYGVLRQTIRNWAIRLAYGWGVSPDRLADYYARHDAG